MTEAERQWCERFAEWLAVPPGRTTQYAFFARTDSLVPIRGVDPRSALDIRTSMLNDDMTNVNDAFYEWLAPRPDLIEFFHAALVAAYIEERL